MENFYWKRIKNKNTVAFIDTTCAQTNITRNEDLLHITKNLYLAKIPCKKLEYGKEIYQKLTTTDLLSQRMKKATQNANVHTQ